LRESPEYRRLWLGQSLSSVGNQMTNVAVPVQVYAMTHSSLAVGAIGLAVGVPFIAVGLLGGSLADAVDRRKLVIVTSSGLALLSAVFALQAALDLNQLWLLYVVVAVQSCLFAVDQPARSTFIPRLLPSERISAATALTQLSFQLSGTVGPLLAGVVIAAAGLKAAYIIDAATFSIAVYTVIRLRAMPPEGGGAAPGVAAVAEGLRWVRHQPVIAMIFLVDLNAMIFGMPRAVFPALAATHFGGGTRTVGLLYAAPAIGGLLGAAFSGPLAHVRRQGMAVLASVAIWGASIAGFSVSRSLLLGAVLLAVAGAADMVSAVFRQTILLQNVPDALLGRISAVNFVVVAGGPRFGDLEAGGMATLTTPVFSAVSGGLACLVGVVVLGLAVPAFARYRKPEPFH
jgi:MFS family permease